MSHTQQLARGVFWLGSATAVSRIVDAVSSIVVLRVLTGAELGLATLAGTVMAFVEGFNALGMGGVLIQRSNLSPEQISSVWWYVLAVNCALTIGLILSAPLMAGLYGATELTQLIRLAAVKLMFVGLASVPLALLHRQLSFRQVGSIMACATILSSVVTLVLALNGAGAWAPVVGNTAHGLFQLLGTFVFGFYRPRMRFSWAHVAPMAREGVQLAGAGSIAQLTRNVDYLVLGKVAGLGVLGTYRVAFDLAMVPSLIVLQVVNRTSLPIYSRIFGDGGDLSAAFARTLRLIALILVPLLLVAALDGEVLLRLLGKQHDGDISWVIACLCLAAWLRGLSQCTPVLLIASANPGRAVIQAVSSATLLTLSLLIGLAVWRARDPLSVTASAWIVAMVLQLVADFWLVRPALALQRADWLRATLVPAGVAILTAGAVMALRLLVSLDASPLRLAVDALAIVTVFALVLRYGLKIRGLEELRPKPSQS